MVVRLMERITWPDPRTHYVVENNRNTEGIHISDINVALVIMKHR